MARRLKSRPSVARVGDQPVFERVLGNGLKVLVLPRKGVQIVVCDLFYPVGSFDEPPGKSGIAHFLEHMLFKGTERFPKGRIDQLAFLAGGQANADTGEDRTHYFFSLPADRWELALEIEADRMVHARFDPREVEAERQVIGEERARDVESPLIRLDQTHQALSYLRHPYRDPVIGWPEDLAMIGAEDLEAFYRRHYRPDGAVLVLTGDVEPDMVLDRAVAHFGAIPPGGTPRSPRRTGVEAPQTGRRDFVMDDPDALPRGILGWHTVPEDHPDSPALEVLADILSAGRRSRLWRSLVDEDRLVGWVEAAHACGRQAGQFFVQLEAAEDQIDPTEVEEAVADVIADLAEIGPAPEELARVRNRFEAGWRWDQEDLLALACGVGQAALWGDWRDWQAEHAAALAVEAADVRRVASKYLVESNLTAGWLLRPDDAKPGAGAPPPAPQRRAPARPISGVATTATVGLINIEGPKKPAKPTPRLLDYHPRRFVLTNGLRVIYERRPGVGVAAVDLYIEGGWVREAVPGVSALTSRMLEEGSVGRSSQELAAAIEDVGGSLELSSTWSSLRTRSEDLGLGLELLADVVRRPLFPPEALGWAKQRIIGELRGDREDPAFRADQAFRAMVYGDHPLGRDHRGGVREIGRLTREDLLAHHRRCFTPETAFLVAVGEFDPRQLRRMIEKQFGDWAPNGEAAPSWPALPAPGRPRSRRIDHPGEQVHIVLGHRGIARRHPDFDALLVLDHILGSGPGFSDRLGRIVRDELGLVYTIGGGMTDSADLMPGLFRIYAGTMPEEADRVVAAIVDQIRAMHLGDFSDEEVAGVRQYLAGAALFELQTVEQRAERLVELERLGLPLDEPRTWPDRIAAITPRQVRDAARVHLHPDALFRVALGPLAKARK